MAHLTILIMIQRFDPKTTGSMLREYMDVVSPPPIQKGSQVITQVQEWERKVAALANRYKGGRLTSELKLAILLGMLE